VVRGGPRRPQTVASYSVEIYRFPWLSSSAKGPGETSEDPGSRAGELAAVSGLPERLAAYCIGAPGSQPQCSRQASGAIAASLATLNGGGRSPRRLASRTSASRVGAASAIAARMTGRGARS
jgi:hypothetical protein